MAKTISSTFRLNVYIAGDLQTVRSTCRTFGIRNAVCVTVKGCDFVYDGGLEAGVEVGLLNFPKSPRGRMELKRLAEELANLLIKECVQWTALIVDDIETTWINHKREQDNG